MKRNTLDAVCVGTDTGIVLPNEKIESLFRFRASVVMSHYALAKEVLGFASLPVILIFQNCVDLNKMSRYIFQSLMVKVGPLAVVLALRS